jgi:hypothetical protein
MKRGQKSPHYLWQSYIHAHMQSALNAKSASAFKIGGHAERDNEAAVVVWYEKRAEATGALAHGAAGTPAERRIVRAKKQTQKNGAKSATKKRVNCRAARRLRTQWNTYQVLDHNLLHPSLCARAVSTTCLPWCARGIEWVELLTWNRCSFCGSSSGSAAAAAPPHQILTPPLF